MTSVIIISVSVMIALFSLGCAVAFDHFDAKGDDETKHTCAFMAIASQIAVLALLVTI